MVIHPLIIRKGSCEDDEPTGVGHRVRFFDYDGTLLKTEFVEDGGDATRPAIHNPVPATDKSPALSHGFSWNNSTYNIKTDVDISNMYNPLDYKSHFYLELDEDTGYSCDMLFYKTNTVLMYIDWGDGSALESSNVRGNVTFSHTYSGKGNYIIKIWNTPESLGAIRLGQGTQATALFGENKRFKAGVKRIFLSRSVGYIYTYGLADLINLEVISFPSSAMVIASYAFSGCVRLKHAGLYGMTTLGGASFTGCISMGSISFPQGLTAISNSTLYWNCKIKRFTIPYGLQTMVNFCFQNMKAVKQVIIPPNVVSMGVQTFGGMELVEWYKVLPTTPPTITDTTFANCSAICRFYVPDASWTSYNNADYWKDLNLYKLSDFKED